MAFSANEFSLDAGPIITVQDGYSSGQPWIPLFWHSCGFGPDVFTEVMLNLIKNPNINSSWLFRADIVLDEQGEHGLDPHSREAFNGPSCNIPAFDSFVCKRYLVRTLIPRNTLRDKPLDQTCLIYESGPDSDQRKRTLVVYLPHVSSEDDMPFYHPKVQGIAFLHEWRGAASEGSISISYSFFSGPAKSSSNKLTRTALNLLSVIHKHGTGRISGYVKRVQHDLLVPQAPFQDRYTALKQKYAKTLIDGWAESTDPVKHVFEDLGIASFLIELWAGMYSSTEGFPGFVDIGCGNGLLVYILNQEGYRGWGFDARARKSWQSYSTPQTASDSTQDTLRQLILVPSILRQREPPTPPDTGDVEQSAIHDGCFPVGTFIISNHADELTPWTPILAADSQCPFIMIPCCSHNLSGAKFRAPPPKDKTKSESAYSSLVSWAAALANDCGWEVETEMLRIPSTRNTALVGRRRTSGDSNIDTAQIIREYGGAVGYLENALKLAKAAPRGH